MTYLQGGLEGIGIKNIGKTYIKNLQIPIPPSINEQQSIVAQMEAIDQQIDQARAIIDKQEQAIKEIDLSIYPTKKLGDKKYFSLQIGQRVLKKDIKSYSKDNYPIYSANVLSVFGYKDKPLPSLTTFDKSSVLWGIDGDWLVNYIDANKPFYPTDHCGVLRSAEGSSIDIRYVLLALKEVGINEKFDRNYRASIDRMQSIDIPLPPVDKQKIIGDIIENCHKNITNQLEIINKLEQQKQAIMQEIFTIEEVS